MAMGMGHLFKQMCCFQDLKTHLKKTKTGHWWLRPIILDPWRLILEGSRFEASPGKYFMSLYLQNNQSKMDWKYSSSGRMLAF
jgi:hypothetical protein